MADFRGIDWDLADTQGKIGTWERVGIAVLMDIRDELKALNELLRCPNFTGIPATLRSIQRNTRRAKKRRG